MDTKKRVRNDEIRQNLKNWRDRTDLAKEVRETRRERNGQIKDEQSKVDERYDTGQMNRIKRWEKRTTTGQENRSWREDNHRARELRKRDLGTVRNQEERNREGDNQKLFVFVNAATDRSGQVTEWIFQRIWIVRRDWFRQESSDEERASEKGPKTSPRTVIDDDQLWDYPDKRETGVTRRVEVSG